MREPMTSSLNLLPGTAVSARGLRWEVVTSQNLGPQTLLRLRGTENAVLGQELDILCPFESVEPVRHDLRPDRAAPLDNWLVYHQAFLLEQALGPAALLAVQPGRLRIESYQLVPVLRAIRMSRRANRGDGVGTVSGARRRSAGVRARTDPSQQEPYRTAPQGTPCHRANGEGKEAKNSERRPHCSETEAGERDCLERLLP